MAKNYDKPIQTGGGLTGAGPTGGSRGSSLAEALDAMATGHLDKDFSQVKPSIDRVAKADPKDVQEVAASQLQLMAGYHRFVVSQSSRCFFWALVGAGVGLGFFL